MDILLVDDDLGDTMIIEDALNRCAPDASLRTAQDGVEALELLRGAGPANHPDLILLDLNMPRMNGHEVLAELKADEQMRHIPVVVLTTSAAQEDVLGSYRLHANAYVTKPVELAAFAEVIEKIDTFYGRIAALPRPKPGDD